MRRIHPFAAFFNIQPGEEHLTGLLILLSFGMELAFVLLQSMAFGVFIAEYGPQALPYSYIAIAIFASLAAALYIRLGERVPFSTALMFNLASLGTLNILVWLGLKSPFTHSVSFVLPLLFQIVLNLGSLVLWQLAGRLFNLQQAKRLFPLLNAGGWLANILGGLLVLPLVEWVNVINLLVPATLMIGLSMLTLRTITHNYPVPEASTPKPRRTSGHVKPLNRFLRNRYVLLIFTFIVIWWIAYFFLDNIFADRAAAQFPDVNQLTIFRGQLLSLTGIVAILTSTFLAGRIIRRFGLLAGLLAEALPVAVILGSLAISGSLGIGIIVGFVLATLAKLVNVAFGFSVSQSAYLMLYQPLPNTERGRVQATAEGIFQPVASGFAGLTLLALTSGLKFSYLGLSYVYLGVAACLLLTIVLLSKGYVNAITQAITKRRLGESPVVFTDLASLNLLKHRLYDPHPGVVMYALSKLDELDSKSVTEALPKLMQHASPEVRREAFVRIETLKLRTMLRPVHEQLMIEADPLVKEYGLRALGCIADAESHSPLLNALHETEAHSLRGALIGLLKYQESPMAGQVLDRLSHSLSVADRALVAQILGEINQAHFHQIHQTLLCDPDPIVKRAALQAVARSRHPALFPFLIEACDSSDTSHAAAQALTDIGSDIFPAIEAAFSQPVAPRQRLLTLSRVLGRIGERLAQVLLFSRISSSDSELRSQVLNALSECGYRAEDPSEIYTAIKTEIWGMTWTWAALADLGNSNEITILLAALNQFNIQARDRVLLLLSFVFDTQAMLRVRETLRSGSTSQLTYVLEIIEIQLPADWKPIILPVFENLSPQERLQRLDGVFPQVGQASEERLQSLIEGRQFTEWIRACALYTAGKLRAQSCYKLIQDATAESNALIHDTACWALTQFSTDGQGENNPMLSIIEKVLILKTVHMFSQTPDDVLADVADLLEEMDVAENEIIFKKGEPGDSMYIIVDGKVQVHMEERLLNYLGESDVFGEMALLDPEPRLASVTAVEPTRLFRLDQSPFYQLIAERPEVATGIIRSLTRLLRDRVRDLSKLDSRIKELERSLQGSPSDSI